MAYLLIPPPGNHYNFDFDKINGLLDLFAHKITATAVPAVSKKEATRITMYYYSSFVVLDVIYNVFNNEKIL